MTPSDLLEQNLDRVVDSVLRSLEPGRMAESTGIAPVVADEATSRQIMADLCGHVAFALRSLDGSPHPVGIFRPVSSAGSESPRFDVRR